MGIVATRLTYIWCRYLSNWPSPWPRPSAIGRVAESSPSSWPGWSARLWSGCPAVAGTPISCPRLRTRAWRPANGTVWTRIAAAGRAAATASPLSPTRAVDRTEPSTGRHRPLPPKGLPKKTYTTSKQRNVVNAKRERTNVCDCKRVIRVPGKRSDGRFFGGRGDSWFTSGVTDSSLINIVLTCFLENGYRFNDEVKMRRARLNVVRILYTLHALAFINSSG